MAIDAEFDESRSNALRTTLGELARTGLLGRIGVCLKDHPRIRFPFDSPLELLCEELDSPEVIGG
jgi:hypothetical protein